MSSQYEDIVARTVLALEEEFGSAIVDDYLYHYDYYDNLVDEQAVIEVRSEQYGKFKLLVLNPEKSLSKRFEGKGEN